VRLETPKDLLDTWLANPPTRRCEDPRFEVKQALPEAFERIYTCVDESFQKPRPRGFYDWLYRLNPYGRARVWYVEEVATSRILKTGAFFPWPIAYGEDPLKGSLAGDFGTVPDWQRRGLSAPSRTVRRSHSFHGEVVSISGPNQNSRAVIKKAGEQNSILGPLPGGVAVLDGGPLLERLGFPSWLSRPTGKALGGGFSALRRLTCRSSNAFRFEPLSRFTSDLDAVTWETMRFPHYWCPHNAEWLNWRYLDHPLESYAGFALLDSENDRPVGYSTLRLAGQEATLSEFAASPEHARSLLAHTLSAARSAGCSYVNFFAPPRWRHWGLFRRAGFLAYRTNNFMLATDWKNEEQSHDVNQWQLTPGDRDLH